MAIDPAQITTVNVEQLPITPITPESIIPHSIGGILYQATISEIVSLVPSATWRPYQVMILNVTDLYIENNFESDGLGVVGLLWEGWQIMNGNRGTVNMDNAIPLGFGTTRISMKEQVGENTKALVKSNIPPLDFTPPTSNADNGGGDRTLIMATSIEPAGEKTYYNVVNKLSTATPISIMQKSFVQLYIMKLP